METELPLDLLILGLIGMIAYVAKKVLPETITSWFTKEKELRDAFFKAKILEERALYKQLWQLVSEFDDKADIEDPYLKLSNSLKNFKFNHFPFIHPDIRNQIDKTIDCIGEDELCGNNNAHEEVYKCIEALGEVISTRIYRYDR